MRQNLTSVESDSEIKTLPALKKLNYLQWLQTNNISTRYSTEPERLN